MKIISFAELQRQKKEREAAMLARAEALPAEPPPPLHKETLEEISTNVQATASPTRAAINYNEKQSRAIHYAADFSTQDLVIIGSAGTGKTTTQRGMVETLLPFLPMFGGVSKTLMPHSPAMVITCPTNRGCKPIKRAVGDLLPANIATNHKIQEYEPVFYDVTDDNGNVRKTMQFLPMRNAANPIPEILLHITDEAGLCSVEMDKQNRAAMPNARRIYSGDIYQLPPVYGSSILGYKLAEAAAGKIPLVELTEVYRQALDSPILARAIEVKNGFSNSFSVANCKKKWTQSSDSGTLVFTPIPDSLARSLPRGMDEETKQDRLDAIMKLNEVFGRNFQTAFKNGVYDPEEDVILIPHRKPHTFGAYQLNRFIAQAISEKSGSPIQEVIAGFQKYYYSVGDRVTDGKIEGNITRIVPNIKYQGKTPKPTDSTDRWGRVKAGHEDDLPEFDLTAPNMTNDDIDAFLTQDLGEDSQRKQAASHILHVQPNDGNPEFTLETSAELNNINFSYVLTVHQSQGSEWRKVFLILHPLHSGMYKRELLYTAMTRAREYCEIIARPAALEICCKSAIIKGVTLAEKAEYFKGKMEAASKEMQE